MEPGKLKPRPPKADPDAEVLQCEYADCPNTFAKGDAYSFAGGLAMTGPKHDIGTRTLGVQCAEEQHLCCCLEHALYAHISCQMDHVIPVHNNRRAMLDARLAEILAAQAGGGNNE